jgi:hypothetical protein
MKYSMSFADRLSYPTHNHNHAFPAELQTQVMNIELASHLPNYKVLQNRIFKLMGEIVIKVNGDRGTPIIGTDAVAAGVPVKAKIFLVPPERKTGIHTLQDYPSASKESDENIVNSTTSSTRSGTGGKKSRRNKQKKKRRVTRKQRKTYKHNTKKVHKKHKKTIKH